METAASESTAAASESTAAAPDATIISTEEHVVERPEETSTGISKPSWMTEKAEESGDKSKTGDSKADEKPAAESKAATSGPNAETQPAEAKETEEEAEAKTVEHPKGYVPVAAVQEARAEMKLLRGELKGYQMKVAELEQAAQAKQEAPKVDEFQGFQVLTDDELEILGEDDPREAAAYVKKLVKYERHQAEQEATKEQRAQQEHREKVLQQVAYDRIAELVPDQDSNAALSKFAVDNGLPAEAFFITDPTTMVILPGTKIPVALNQYAADIVAFLANIQKGAANKGSLAIDDIPDDLKAKIVAEASEKILSKVKTGNKPRSVSNLPSSNRESGDRFAGKAYKDLSPDERQAYLGG